MDIKATERLLVDRVERILQVARVKGATAAEVSVAERVGLGVTVRQQETETVEFNQDRRFHITVYQGQRKGSASTSDGGDEAIASTVKAALDIARYTEDDSFSGLAEASLMAAAPVDLALFHPWDLPVDQAEALARACEAEALAVSRVHLSHGASVGTSTTCSVYGNSHGFVGAFSGTRHYLNCSVLAKDEQGMQDGYWHSMGRNHLDLEEAGAIGREAGRRAVSHLGARTFATGVMPVLFAPETGSGLLGHLISAISGTALYKKASFLVDQLGEPVTSPQLTISENPLLIGGLGSAWFDGDGVGTSAKAFIDQGVLRSYVLGTYSARRLGLASTGNADGIHNLSLAGNVRSAPDLLRQMGNGVLVTSLMGQGINIVNGDYSRGARGFRVKDGEITHAIDGFTIAANLRDIFKRIVAIGDDVDLRSNIRSPSILVEAMTVAR
jgi:PmbA protein